jgi:putative ABC transport system permease protein
MRLEGPLEKRPWIEIVGVVQDVKHELNLPVTPDYYLPHQQDPWGGMVLVAKTTVDPASMSAAIRQQVLAIDKNQPVYDVKTMNEVRSISVAVYSFGSATMAIFALVALLLAAIGIYGVMAFAVTQRTHEIGIRMALGARAIDVLRLVVRNGMTLAVIGVVAGLVGSIALTRLLTSLLFGVSPTDVVTFSLVTLGLLLVALVACYIPARRATKVDPMVALRYE